MPQGADLTKAEHREAAAREATSQLRKSRSLFTGNGVSHGTASVKPEPSGLEDLLARWHAVHMPPGPPLAPWGPQLAPATLPAPGAVPPRKLQLGGGLGAAEPKGPLAGPRPRASGLLGFSESASTGAEDTSTHGSD